MLNKKCNVCKKVFWFQPCRKSRAKYCSKVCMYKGIPKGSEHKNFRGGRKKHSRGYWYIYKPDDKQAKKGGYVYEHRWLVEQKIGRTIDSKKEHVHHIDGNPSNNNLENLVLLSHRDHHRIHLGWWKEGDVWWKKCHRCEKSLEFNNNNFYIRSDGGNVSFCKECSKQVTNQKRRKHVART